MAKEMKIINEIFTKSNLQARAIRIKRMQEKFDEETLSKERLQLFGRLDSEEWKPYKEMMRQQSLNNASRRIDLENRKVELQERRLSGKVIDIKMDTSSPDRLSDNSQSDDQSDDQPDPDE